MDEHGDAQSCDVVMPPPAIWGRSLNKSYGLRSNKLDVLINLDITVPQGAIYGLLGPSGCGKTTLLRCIVGRLDADSGHLIVLGDKPGTRGHGIPGSMVGYMPQETSLFSDFTIGETLSYFGRIHRMSRFEVKNRTEFLLDLLTLPSHKRLIKQLSGGQKRRVSFAVALLQKPELLILDEPTVGVDPLLREKIWEHLIRIARHDDQKTTIIITTHYIEEARQADKVGLMRNGHLLAEESPDSLIEAFHMQTLEAVFLKMCQTDETLDDTITLQTSDGDNDNSTHGNNCSCFYCGRDSVDEKTPLLSKRKIKESSVRFQERQISVVKKFRCPISCPSAQNMFAQIIKNMTLMQRNIGFLLFEFLLPSIQIILFCICIGSDPFNVAVSIVNKDNGSMQFGHMYINTLSNTTFNKIYFDDFDAAIESVHHGDSWGVISIGQNFSEDLIKRFMEGSAVTNATLDGSSVKMYLDMTSQEIAVIIQQDISTSFQSFAKTMLGKSHLNPGLADLPIKFETPVYGDNKPSFRNFMAPGVIISITFFMATGLTTLVFVLEKKEGLLDRSQVAGMTAYEIMLAHVVTQLLVLIIQVSLLLVFVLAVFHIPYKGPLIWVVLIVFLQGFCGMTLGVIISSVCDNENSAIQLVMGSMYPAILISGILWPIEAMPMWIRYISMCLPMTYAAEAMRCVLSRGWDVTEFLVYRGYLVAIGWSLGLLLISAIILKVKQL